MNKNITVTKHNHLIEASYKLSLEEQRLLLACIAKINPNNPVPSSITVTAKEYSDHFGIQLKNAYVQMKQAIDSLYERDIKIKNNQTRKRRRWVQGADYNKSEGSITLIFSDYVKPYISQLNGMFKSYQIKNISSLKSTHSIRMYELLNQWKSSGKRFINLEDFKEMLQIGDKYDRYADLRKWVIEPAIKELNTKTDFSVTFEPEKEGRKVVRLSFFFTTQSMTKS